MTEPEVVFVNDTRTVLVNVPPLGAMVGVVTIMPNTDNPVSVPT